MMDIPQGYKQTELGIIPDDWEVVSLGSVAKINGRIGFRGYTTADLVEAGQGAYTIGGKHITNMVLDLQDAEYISWQKYYESPEIMVRKGDIVLAQRGTLGKSAFIRNDIGPATINPSLVLINKIKCDNEYLSYWLQCDKIVEYICAINSQTSIPMITQNQIEYIPVVLPTTKEEQQAIAEALSDIDGLIAALDKKIAKKRLIKQGAMQQLLTGKKRLPGFSDPWVEKKLGEIGVWAKGQSLSKDDIIPNGKYVCIHYGELFSYGEVITSPSSRTNCQPMTISMGNELLFPDSDVTPNGLGRCSALLIKGVIIGSGINILRHKPLYDTSFVSYSINVNKSKIIDRVTGTTVKHINSKELSEIMINIPKTKEEQTAIATILSDMDKEITDLEAKRDKYRLLKSGMMQKLLTGQIRLKTE